MKLCRFAMMVLLAASGWGQENARAARNEGSPAKHRPRIGLALEGGGALGLAHVGVIQWLEENRIPVDVIAGTSMGGLVGGIYATGKSPEPIRELLRAKGDHCAWEPTGRTSC
ncbi:MAG TPA: patatin-like phospholipase family protein [Terriglobales bacterium]|nr:patatin-like phospholipase family protein [Terriglobales bacterium]